VRGWRGALICVFTIYIAAAAEESFGDWRLLGGRTDFLLLAMSVLCTFASRRGGALLGFSAGWLYGALDGANMWQYVASRTLGGFAIAWLAESGIVRGYLTAVVAGVFGVIFCQCIQMFLAPPPVIGHFLGDTIRTAAYNGVLAILVYAVFKRILDPRG